MEDDSGTILEIVPADDSTGRATETDGTIEFSFPGNEEEHALNVDAIFQFGTSGTGSDTDNHLFSMTNQSTETVEVTDDHRNPDPEAPRVGIFHVAAEPTDEGL